MARLSGIFREKPIDDKIPACILTLFGCLRYDSYEFGMLDTDEARVDGDVMLMRAQF